MLRRAKSIGLRLSKDERGASLLEYTILLGLILAASVTAVLALGTYTGNYFSNFKQYLESKVGTGAAPPTSE
jgi:Flp pilus assembly pilin Flp